MLHLILPIALAGPTPEQPDTLAPDRNWDLQTLHLDLAVDLQGESIAGTATLQFSPLTPGSDTLWVHQVGLNVQEVRINGEKSEFQLGDTHLAVQAPSDADVVELAIDYKATPQKGLHFRKKTKNSPDSYNEVWSQGEDTDNRFWFPSWDYPNDRFTYSGRFVVPKGYKVLSNGLGSFDGTAWNYALKEDMVNYLVMLAVGPYQIREAKWRDTPVEQWFPPDANEDEVIHISGKVPDMLELFSQKTGLDYPYPTYREVFVQRFLYTGMENTTATVEERNILRPSKDGDLAQSAQSVVAHEAAHQWFGDALTCKTWHELWLNEGFATYFAGLWEQEEYGDANFYDDVYNWYRWSLKAGPMSGRWWSTEEGDHAERTAVYVRGASTLQMLYVMVGEEAFWKSVQKYVADNTHALVETDDLRLAFESVTGQHLGWFFDQWTHLPGSPTVTVKHQYADGVLRVDVSQEGKMTYTFPLDIEIGTDDGPVHKREWVNQATTRFSVPLEKAPSYVAADPQGGVLAKFDNQQSVQSWLGQLKSTSPYARLNAIRALGEKKATTETVEALAKILTSKKEERTYRQVAAQSLGKLDHPTGDKALANTLPKAKSPSLRKSIAHALAHGRELANESRVLGKVADKDPTIDVQASALRSLSHFDREGALRRARAILRRKPGKNVSLHRTAASLLSKHGNESDMPLLLKHMNRSSKHALAGSVLWSAMHLANELDDTAREKAQFKIAKKIQPWLSSRHLRTRQNALYGLKEVGNESNIPALQTLKAHTDLSSSRKKAEEAIEAIRNRKDDPKPEAAEVADELKKLEERIDAIEKRLEEEKKRH